MSLALVTRRPVLHVWTFADGLAFRLLQLFDTAGWKEALSA